MHSRVWPAHLALAAMLLAGCDSAAHATAGAPEYETLELRYQGAIEWARSQPQDVVRARYVKMIERRKRGEDVGIVRYWKSSGIAQPGGVITDRDMRMWIDFMEKDGTLQPKHVALKDVFTNEFNPYRDKTRQ